jgi:SAM-dependent methyltransferase
LSEQDPTPSGSSGVAPGAAVVDVGRLLAETSVEQACATAERYFEQLQSWDHHLAKPFSGPEDAPALLISFATLLQGLAVSPGLEVLDFGAGTCWTTRFLSQMGLRVTAADVSRTALAIGEELFRRLPPIGERPAPRFLHFDGRRLDLPSGSVDRVFCLDAFHHVPNQREVLAELARVLRDGGVAGFSEPGPDHSRSPQSQYEMRTFGVVENDVRIEEIWDHARAAGFADLRLAAFSTPGMLLSWPEYVELLAQGEPAARLAAASRQFLAERRTFFLYKGAPPTSAAQYRAGLLATLVVAPATARARAGEVIPFTVSATNAGAATWLPHGGGFGGVSLGVHLYDAGGAILRHSYHWEPITAGDGRPVAPGETVVREAGVPAPAPGRYLLEFDLVAADVVWFGLNGSVTPRVEVEVVEAEEGVLAETHETAVAR